MFRIFYHLNYTYYIILIISYKKKSSRFTLHVSTFYCAAFNVSEYIYILKKQYNVQIDFNFLIQVSLLSFDQRITITLLLCQKLGLYKSSPFLMTSYLPAPSLSNTRVHKLSRYKGTFERYYTFAST